MKKLLTALTLTLTALFLTLSLSSCMKAEDYYTRADVEALITELNTALSAKEEACNAKIQALREEYEAKVAELEAAGAENAAAIADLTATYEAKVAEIEADYEEKFESVNELITALQEADLDNVRRIAILEAQIEALLSKHEHTFGDWSDFGVNANVYCEQRFFFRACTECNVVELKYGSYEDHDFNTVTTPPTCVAGGYDTLTCEICGKVEVKNETAIVDHDFKSEYSTDNSFHWYDCKNCDETTGKTEHTTDDSGYCTVCNAPVGSTVGIIYELSSDGTYAEVIGYTGTAKNIIIAEEYNGVPVRTIYNQAFESSNIRSVIIPDSVTRIGAAAFRYCTSLTSVSIPDSVTSIGSNAFSDCNSSLYTEYEFGRYVGSTENPYAVLIELTNKNLSTYTINEKTKVIAYGVFSDCERLTEITIPDSVTSIGEGEFYVCSSLTSVTIPDSVTSIGEWAFNNCSSLTSVTIPDSVTSIGNYAFWYCTSLTSVTIGNGVTSIGASAFYGCSSLTSVTIGNGVTSIGSYAFYDCSGLTSVTIPDSVTSIGNYAFYYCTSLTSVTIGNGVTSIGDSAFENCRSLTSVTIPDSVTSIGERAFYVCSSLTTINYTGTESEWAAIEKGNNAIPSGCTIVYNYTKE